MSNEPMDKLSQKLSKRWEEPSSKKQKKTSTSTRRNRSMFLDQSVFDRLDEVFNDVSYELKKKKVKVGKSDFMEAVLSYGLDNIEEVKAALQAEKG